METHNSSSSNNFNLMLKVSRLLPSSCHFRTIPDVAETSINSTLTKTSTSKKPLQNDPSNYSSSSFRRDKPEKIPKKLLCSVSSDAGGRRCPPVTPVSSSNPKKGNKIHPKNAISAKKISSNSSKSSGWFSSGGDGETDTFFSLSSNSGDSFRLKTSRRFKMRDEVLKSIDETGPRCSFSSVGSLDTVLAENVSANMTRKEPEKNSVKCTKPERTSSDKFLADQLYYHRNNARRQRVVKTRRRAKKSRCSTSRVFDSTVIGESYAVEKSSRDPRGDFRASMVEMIVEKQMFGVEDLERLLLCFLSLNAVRYHGMIYDVFTEICETLFTN